MSGVHHFKRYRMARQLVLRLGRTQAALYAVREGLTDADEARAEGE